MADSDRNGANRVALWLLAACQIEGRVLNHLSEQGRQADFHDLSLDLANHNRRGTEQIQTIPALRGASYFRIFSDIFPSVS